VVFERNDLHDITSSTLAASLTAVSFLYWGIERFPQT
jgi:hypothetical protein